MKRIHVFEFEDFEWFPSFLRDCMTRYILAIHKLLKTEDDLIKLISGIIQKTNSKRIIDLCSGSGGPMIDAVNRLKQKEEYKDLELTLTDLYPNQRVAISINKEDTKIHYETNPADASHPGKDRNGIRTMICSMHHMKPDIAKKILKDAQEEKQPICIFEISDNHYPIWLDWLALPINILSVFLITPMVRPFTWRQFIFTYIIPLLPIFIAWDGAISNMRTYTLSDMDELLEGLHSDSYEWEKGTIEGRARKLYLIGTPKY